MLAGEEKDDADTTVAAAAKPKARRRAQDAPAAAASMLTPFAAVTAAPASNAWFMQAIFEDSSGSDAAPDWDEAVPKPGASGTAAKGRGSAPPPFGLICELWPLLYFAFLVTNDL